MASNNRITTELRHLSSQRNRRPVSCPVSAIRARSAAKHGYSQPDQLECAADTSALLDKWPANISAHGTPPLALKLTRDRQLIVVDEEATGKAQHAPKPRFLDKLETFLKKELRALGVSETQSSEPRLQVFREVFDLLIQDFRTYQPMLSAIKNEYEMMISQQREEIRKFSPLKQMLVTVTEQCDQKIMKLKQKENREIRDLQMDNKALHKQLGDMQVTQLQLEAQVERLHEELRLQYEQLRDETDSRKLLVVKLNEYHMAQDDAMMATQNYLAAQDQSDDINDPVTLNIALKRARVRETQLTEDVERLEQEISSYVDVIPSRDHEKLKQTHKTLQEDFMILKGESDKLTENYDALYQKLTEARAERNELQKDLDSLQTKSLTPRPDWDKCADYIDGGLVHWKQLSRGKRSDELVSLLLKELSETENPSSSSNKIGDSQGDDGLVLISSQLALKLMKHNIENTNDGFIKKTDFSTILENFFPTKDKESLSQLMKAADMQLEAKSYDMLAYSDLFIETEDCKLGAFLDELSVQYYRERREYIEDIWEELSSTDPVTVEDLRRALTIIDPEIKSPDVDKYLCFAFNVREKDAINNVQPQPLMSLLRRLQRGMLRRIGKMM